LYKSAAILYFICFVCYILFSRNPDYFESEFTKGVIVQTSNRTKQVQYSVGNYNYKRSIESWGASQFKQGQHVSVIYNPSIPTEGSLYSFFSYWLKLKELLITACLFIILLFAAVFITGKEETYYYSDEEKRKKRKYDD
jgi:hypothetical protein